MIPKVAGSIPVSHPKYEKAVSAHGARLFFFLRKRPPNCYAIMMAQWIEIIRS